MYLQSNNVIVTNTSYVALNNVTISNNGYIEIPDGPTHTVNIGNSAYIEFKNVPVHLNNAMWSWWTKPLILREISDGNNRTYTTFTQSNGAVGVGITDNLTGNTEQYTLTLANTFYADDHNAGAVCTGNGKVVVFIQGRNVANANVLNPNNMFYIEWNEGSPPTVGNLVNITFSTANTAVASYYPNAFNSNGRFILFGRQQQQNTANQWIYARSSWPLANFASPQGFFRSSNSWPYFAFRRGSFNPNIINFALGWHPIDSDSNRSIYYGNIFANTISTTPWDVYANESIIGNLTTGAGMPIDQDDLELVYANPDGAVGNNRTRLFDVSDGSIAFGSFDRNTSIVEYKMAYRVRSDLWLVYTICSGGLPFHGVGVREYFGGMAIGELDKFQITVAVNVNQKWEIREYKIPSETYFFIAPSGAIVFYTIPIADTQWTLDNVIEFPVGETVGRPMSELLSESSISAIRTNRNINELGTLYWRGFYDGSDFTIYNTNVETSRYRTFGPGIANTLIDTSNRANFSYLNVAPGSYIEVASPSSNSGYTMAGAVFGPAVFYDTIDRFPFAADGTAVSVGSATRSRRGPSGQTSYVNGYVTGGFTQTTPASPVTVEIDTIDRFSFVNNAPATNIGGLARARGYTAGISSSTFGYLAGGFTFQSPPNNSTRLIDKFPFAVDSYNATTVGTLDIARFTMAGQQSSTNGYASGGGIVPPPTFNSSSFIEKFLFSTDSNANIIGYLSSNRRNVTGQSSSQNGYTSGGRLDADTTITTIDKMPFATDVNATYVADLSIARRFTAGQSSTTHGYNSGGTNPNISPSTAYSLIDKFPFATDSTAVSVGNLSQTRSDGAGTQS
jgi:hypothetical protein